MNFWARQVMNRCIGHGPKQPGSSALVCARSIFFSHFKWNPAKLAVSAAESISHFPHSHRSCQDHPLHGETSIYRSQIRRLKGSRKTTPLCSACLAVGLCMGDGVRGDQRDAVVAAGWREEGWGAGLPCYPLECGSSTRLFESVAVWRRDFDKTALKTGDPATPADLRDTHWQIGLLHRDARRQKWLNTFLLFSHVTHENFLPK